MDVSVRPRSVLWITLLVVSGCRATDPSIELLESEMRCMEDQLYALDRQLDLTFQQLTSANNSNRALRRELAEIQRDRAQTRTAPTPKTAPPAVDVPEIEQFDEQDLTIPRIELGPESTEGPTSTERAAPQAQPPAQTPGGSESAPSTLPQTPSPSPGTSPPQLEENLDDFTHIHGTNADVQVSRITLNNRLTGGYDFDGRPGDDGLLLVIEPQDSTGQYVPLPGDVVIEVTDPASTGPDSRLARWEFDAAETVGYIKTSLLGRGMHIKLPWPGHVPESERLRVTVQYQPHSGDVLSVTRDIRVKLMAGHRTAESTSTAGLPDQFFPTSPPQISHLLPDGTLTTPDAPIPAPVSVQDVDSPRQSTTSARRAATRPSTGRSARNPQPQWTPYR
jgi:hypothetical protein